MVAGFVRSGIVLPGIAWSGLWAGKLAPEWTAMGQVSCVDWRKPYRLLPEFCLCFLLSKHPCCLVSFCGLAGNFRRQFAPGLPTLADPQGDYPHTVDNLGSSCRSLR